MSNAHQIILKILIKKNVFKSPQIDCIPDKIFIYKIKTAKLGITNCR